MKILFRHHRGSLNDSMSTIQEFNSLNDLAKYLENYCKKNEGKNLYIELHNGINQFDFKDLGHDDRIGWNNTFMVGTKRVVHKSMKFLVGCVFSRG